MKNAFFFSLVDVQRFLFKGSSRHKNIFVKRKNGRLTKSKKTHAKIIIFRQNNETFILFLSI